MPDHASELNKLLGQAERWKAEKADLALSGALMLLESPEVWTQLTGAQQARRRAVLASWRPLRGHAGKVHHPFGGCVADDFKAKARQMADWLREVEKDDRTTLWHHISALQLVGRGFRCPKHLEGVRLEAVCKFSQHERRKSMLVQSKLLQKKDKSNSSVCSRFCCPAPYKLKWPSHAVATVWKGRPCWPLGREPTLRGLLLTALEAL